MRIKIFAHPNCQVLEKEVNSWIVQNEENCKVLEIVYKDNGIHFSVLIKYKR